MRTAQSEVSVDQVIEDGLVTTAFQPIVELSDGDVVAYEALSRGPADTTLRTPDALFEAAAAAGLTEELDRLCMQTAFDSAERAGVRTLFVNAEPRTFSGPIAHPSHGMQVVVEVTERGVVDNPAQLLDSLERAREAGWGIALDDIGADWRSLAMLPLIAPEVIKLDRAVLANGPTRESGRILRASRAHVDRRGGTLLAEGIEDSQHAQFAIGFGAALGQGFYLGRPGPAPLGDAVSAASLRYSQSGQTIERRLTPFGLLEREGIATAVTTKRHLLPISHDIEHNAADQIDPHVLLSTFEEAERFTPATRERYAELTKGLAFVAAFGRRMEPRPVPGVIGADLDDDEPLAREWVVVSIGAHQTSALIARDLGDVQVPDLDRRFRYALLSDRDIIESAGRSLMLRITATQPPRN